MDNGYLILFGCGLGLVAVLLWMLLPIGGGGPEPPGRKARGNCPICGQGLFSGERIRSDVTEIGEIEVQTRIKGCPYCMGALGNRTRSCPVCKKKLPEGEVILAIADPRVDRRKLSIRGCRECYPQGF